MKDLKLIGLIRPSESSGFARCIASVKHRCNPIHPEAEMNGVFNNVRECAVQID